MTLNDITMDGNEITAALSFINAYGSLTINDGCTIQDCISTLHGAAIQLIGTSFTMNGGTIKNCSMPSGAGSAIEAGYSEIIINNGIIEDCSSKYGAIYLNGNGKSICNVTINNGIFRNNKSTSDTVFEGGFISNFGSVFTINGGYFIDNTAACAGGCIYHNDGYNGTTTYLNGGYFKGNKCTNENYRGSGAVCHSATKYAEGESDLYLSGNVQFDEEDFEESRTDGVYLSKLDSTLRKIWITDVFIYPVTIYAEAEEHYVIAEGSGHIITNSDRKKINFVDVNDDGPWYTVLDKENNQIYITKTKPQDTYFVYYDSNGAEGTVKDDNNGDDGYEAGTTITVESADGLSWEGHSFVEWNTQADGKGTSYHPGDKFKITEDINLYAIFSEPKKKTLTATFYSGDPIQSETKTVEIEENDGNGTVEAPELEAIDGWEKAGWSKEDNQYDTDYAAGANITLTEDTSFYGIYQKNVTLSYYANEGRSMPESETQSCYANVHNVITYKPAEFEVAPGITRDGYTFVEWNTEPNREGDAYHPGEKLKTTDNINLYAIFSNSGTGGGSNSGGNVSEPDNNTANNNGNDDSGPTYTPTVSIPITTGTNNNNGINTTHPDTGSIGTSIVETVPANSSQKDKEPKTGVSNYPQFYASMAMIVGLSYIMIMFFERHGMTEDEKNAYISRIILWAKRGGKLCRLLAVAAIFMVLVYYHSVGKQNVIELEGAY